MKRILKLFGVLAILVATTFNFSSCTKGLEDDVKELQGQLAELQRAMLAMKTVQTIEPLADGKGYKLVFSDGTSISVNNGVDGLPGQDAQPGQDGAPGTRLQVATVEGQPIWQMSNDGGTTWTNVIDPATNKPLVAKITAGAITVDPTTNMILIDGVATSIPSTSWVEENVKLVDNGTTVTLYVGTKNYTFSVFGKTIHEILSVDADAMELPYAIMSADVPWRGPKGNLVKDRVYTVDKGTFKILINPASFDASTQKFDLYNSQKEVAPLNFLAPTRYDGLLTKTAGSRSPESENAIWDLDYQVEYPVGVNYFAKLQDLLDQFFSGTTYANGGKELTTIGKAIRFSVSPSTIDHKSPYDFFFKVVAIETTIDIAAIDDKHDAFIGDVYTVEPEITGTVTKDGIAAGTDVTPYIYDQYLELEQSVANLALAAEYGIVIDGNTIKATKAVSTVTNPVKFVYRVATLDGQVAQTEFHYAFHVKLGGGAIALLSTHPVVDATTGKLVVDMAPLFASMTAEQRTIWNGHTNREFVLHGPAGANISAIATAFLTSANVVTTNPVEFAKVELTFTYDATTLPIGDYTLVANFNKEYTCPFTPHDPAGDDFVVPYNQFAMPIELVLPTIAPDERISAVWTENTIKAYGWSVTNNQATLTNSTANTSYYDFRGAFVSINEENEFDFSQKPSCMGMVNTWGAATYGRTAWVHHNHFEVLYNEILPVKVNRVWAGGAYKIPVESFSINFRSPIYDAPTVGLKTTKSIIYAGDPIELKAADFNNIDALKRPFDIFTTSPVAIDFPVNVGNAVERIEGITVSKITVGSNGNHALYNIDYDKTNGKITITPQNVTAVPTLPVVVPFEIAIKDTWGYTRKIQVPITITL